jgi:hypothetical protein
MYEVVVGIDFGSSRTGFAYSFFNKNKIMHGQIYGSIDSKVPTQIILDDNNCIVQFGANCSQYLNEKGFETNHYFKDIKMNLYENKNFIIAKNSGKQFPLRLVIQKVLEKIKEIAIKEISESRPNLAKETNKIKWVVTVPAIWNERQKSIMMESCVKAGLIDSITDKSLFFALEPEAASLYCSINKEVDQNYFKEGEYYIVCDLGGGTGDIVAHLVGSNNYINEIYPSCGGNYGSNEIDKQIFKDIIFKLFNCQDFNTFYKKYKYTNNDSEDEDENEKAQLFKEWTELEREIKEFKESVTIEKIKNKEKKTLTLSCFKQIFDEDTNINDLVDEYNNNINNIDLHLRAKKNKNKWLIEFPYKIIYYYMKEQASAICKIINNINSKEKIKTLIFVGGYCSNEVIINLIKSGINNVTIYLRPSNPCLAIMDGAVLFGIQPSTINVRKAKYTIGKAVNKVWNEEIHGGKGKKYQGEITGTWYCEGCFSKFITINQSLKYGEEISHITYPRYKDQNEFSLHFYKTKKTDPIFVFEDGIEKIGECSLEIGDEFEEFEDKKIKTTMKFGGTFIDVIAIHQKSGRLVKTTLTFD